MNQFSFEPFVGGDALSEYVSRYRRADLPPIEAGPPLDMFHNEPLPPGYTVQLTWEHPWPFGDRSGVYLIYSESLELLYIGSARTLGKRLYEYFRAGVECAIQHETWPKRPRFVINVAVPADMPFEAPAIEAFLIRRLQPACNTHWK